MTSISTNFQRMPGAVLASLAVALLLLPACRRQQKEVQDNPRLTQGVTMRDVVFHSVALGRDMPYRGILPKTTPAGQKLPVVYLLHGGGGGFRDWSNYSDVARYAEPGLILVMPEGASSYYTNAVERPEDRYEDYIINDLLRDVEIRFAAATGRESRAIVGVSMGGFGAIKLALAHPGLFAFAAGISAAIDVPSRPFSIKRPLQWQQHRVIFGPWGGTAQRRNDPFVLARAADPRAAPYLFLLCGEQEGLLLANRQFAALLARQHLRYEFHAGPGGHDWRQWNARLPSIFLSLREQITRPASSGATRPLKPLRPLNAALAKQYADLNDRIRALMEWYGSGAGPWSGFPGYEEIAERLLRQYPATTLIGAVEDKSLTDRELEGAARTLGGWTPVPDPTPIPASLRRVLLEHCLKSLDQDKVARAKRAFAADRY